jgi:hypothetical protein
LHHHHHRAAFETEKYLVPSGISAVVDILYYRKEETQRFHFAIAFRYFLPSG